MAETHTTTKPTATISERLRAIETQFDGYMFRSRTEARWAVAFNALSIRYEYELEGWPLDDGTLYLPDFYLPRISMWAEVKPLEFTHPERRKCELLVRGTGRGCLLLDGLPDFRSYEGLTLDSGEITSCRYLLDIYAHHRRLYFRERRLFADPGDLELDDFSERYGNAVGAARRERFKRTGYPRLGHEPFNLTPAEMSHAWRDLA
jgi:hypothetical protein